MSTKNYYDTDDDSSDDPPEWPNPEWTPRQTDNFENNMEMYHRLDSEVAAYWFRRTYRPKKRGDGFMKRDHVKLGTPEDYVDVNYEQALKPMSSMFREMMRTLGGYSVDKDELDDAVRGMLRARVSIMKEKNPAALKRLLQQSNRVARLYGLDTEDN